MASRVDDLEATYSAHLETIVRRASNALDSAGFDLRVVDWEAAAGFVGQLLLVLRAVLTIAVMVIFLVTLVIINNTLVTATMERTTEIGTMRALGFSQWDVLICFLGES